MIVILPDKLAHAAGGGKNAVIIPHVCTFYLGLNLLLFSLCVSVWQNEKLAFSPFLSIPIHKLENVFLFGLLRPYSKTQFDGTGFLENLAKHCTLIG